MANEHTPLYIDHGSDFTSQHPEQVAAELRIELIFSSVGRPQGHGKIERFFGTLNTELLPELPGALIRGQPGTPPRLSISELDAAIGTFVVDVYNARVQSEISQSPYEAWRGDGWLPRLPESLEALAKYIDMLSCQLTITLIQNLRHEGFAANLWKICHTQIVLIHQQA